MEVVADKLKEMPKFWGLASAAGKRATVVWGKWQEKVITLHHYCGPLAVVPFILSLSAYLLPLYHTLSGLQWWNILHIWRRRVQGSTAFYQVWNKVHWIMCWLYPTKHCWLSWDLEGQVHKSNWRRRIQIQESAEQ